MRMHVPRSPLVAAAVALMVGLCSAPTMSASATTRSHRPTLDGLADLNLVYSRGGPVMHQQRVYLLFWRPRGYCFEPLSNGACQDGRYIRLIERYFSDIGGSPFYGIVSQYSDRNGRASNHVSLTAMLLDADPYPTTDRKDIVLTDGDVQQELTDIIAKERWPIGLSTAYFVFTAYGTAICSGDKCTSTHDFCAYHSFFHPAFLWMFRSGPPVIYAVMPDAGSVDGCVGLVSPNGDPVADSEIDEASHEGFEMISDPMVNAWADANGLEIGDKCVGVYGHVDQNGADIMLHGHPYLVQAEWSNMRRGCAFG